VVDVESLVDAPGAAWQPAGSARTNAKGRFRYAVPIGPSRSFRLAYRTHIGVCEQIVVRLSELRPATRVVEARPSKFYENAELHRFQPR